MTTPEPVVIRPPRGFLCAVNGTFFRAVDRDYADAALQGSIKTGRYSRLGQPTLYLSASRAGVEAAIIAHPTDADRVRSVLEVRVTAETIVDLRDRDTLARVRHEGGEPFGDWQRTLSGGGEPSSWRARDWIEAQGASGLIDPSRKAPGLWHLVLFRWNVAGAPSVRLSSSI